jgi:hypothetical protein
MYRRKPLNWRKPRKEVTVDNTSKPEKEVVASVSKPKKKNK